MAYSALPAKVANDTITLANYNAIKGNFEAAVPDIFTAKGDIAVATAVNAAAPLGVGANGSIIVAASGEATGYKTQIMPACRVYSDSNIDPAIGSWAVLTWTHERWDTDAMWAIGDPTKLIVPANGDGIYGIGGNVQIDASGDASGGTRSGLQIKVGATVIAQKLLGLNKESYDIAIDIYTQYDLDAADELTLLVWTSTNYNVLATANFSPEFYATWLRDAP